MTRDWFDRVLILAPHADDETIGCGGLLAHLGARAVVRVFGTSDFEMTSGGVVSQTQRRAELADAMQRLGVEDYAVLYEGAEQNLAGVGRARLVTALDTLFEEIQPTAVFTALASHHQDHVEAYQATLSALRMRPAILGIKAVFGYEYPHVDLYPGFRPDSGFTYFDFTPHADAKRCALDAHASQLLPRPNRWLDTDLIMKWGEKRGMETGVAFAEKFYLLRASM